jgi:hypothetical protein
MFGDLGVIPDLLTQKYEISQTQAPCSLTYTVKIIKITAIVLTIIKTVTNCAISVCLNKKDWFSVRKLFNFSCIQAWYHAAVLLSVQLKVRVRLSTLIA